MYRLALSESKTNTYAELRHSIAKHLGVTRIPRTLARYIHKEFAPLLAYQ